MKLKNTLIGIPMKTNKTANVNTSEVFVVDRREKPIYIDWELDDLGLTPEAYRVYCHLSRRAGNDGYAYPSYKSIGKACFSQVMRAGKSDGHENRLSKPMSESRQKLLAMWAIKELVEFGLISIQERWTDAGDRATNIYILQPKENWVGGSPHDPPEQGGRSPHEPPVDRSTNYGGSPHDPKDIQIEDTQSKNTHTKKGDKKQQPCVRVKENFSEEEEKPILVQSPTQDPSEGLKQEQMPSTESCGFSSAREKPGDPMGDRFKAGKKQLCPYPLLVEEELTELWVGEDLPRKQGWTAFHPALIAGVQQHLKQCPSGVASDKAAAISRISSAIKFREVALLLQWFEAGQSINQPSSQPSEDTAQTERRDYMGGTMTKAEFDAFCEAKMRGAA